MNVWEHLFMTGEFAPRPHILAGLTLQQVGARPAGAPHSIYQELWHAAEWQRIVLDRDKGADKRWQEGGQFPTSPLPENEAAWQKLVNSFLADSERALRLAEDETVLETVLETLVEAGETAEGFTWRNALESLAVHSAYHMGKIVLLRQLLGIWSPPPEDV